MTEEVLTVKKDAVLRAAEKCETFKGVAKELWPEVFKYEINKVEISKSPYGWRVSDGTIRRMPPPKDSMAKSDSEGRVIVE